MSHIKRHSIKAHTMALLALSMVIFSVSILVANLIFAYEHRESEATYVRRHANELCHQITDWLETVKASLQSFAFADTVVEYTKTDLRSTYASHQMLREMMNFAASQSSAIRQIRLCYPNGQSLRSRLHTEGVHEYTNFVEEIQQRLVPICLSEGNEIQTGIYTIAEGTIEQPENAHLIYMLVPVRNTYTRQSNAAVVATLDVNVFLSSLPIENFTVSYADHAFFCRQAADAKRLPSECSNVDSPWQVQLFYSPEGVSKELLLMSVMSLIMAALIHLSILGRLNRIILQPMAQLSAQVAHTRYTDDHISSQDIDGNEVESLADALNRMLNRIRNDSLERTQALESLHAMQIKRMNERIMRLQTQMNPHFLYNNLECIRGMSILGDQAAVRQMTSEMASIYRYCLSEQSLASLNDEIECVQAFMNIIQLRYEGRYSLSCEVDDRVRAYQLPRMTLQPILENCISHGFGGRATGSIYLRISDDWLIIEDNGRGMSEDDISALNQTLDKMNEADQDAFVNGRHISLLNINLRLILLGQPHCLRIAHAEAGGLAVWLHLFRL